jgi:hypothetical protein
VKIGEIEHHPFFLSFLAAAHQLICSSYLFSDDLPTVKEKKQLLKRKHALESPEGQFSSYSKSKRVYFLHHF